jgi:uncharacterized Ntn-hydrolase superfamily protein
MRRGTYSIVARDPDSGELGIAAQSHWLAIGAIVPWAQPDVGAVTTSDAVPETMAAAFESASGRLGERLLAERSRSV